MTLPVDSLAWAVKAFRDERGMLYAKYRRYLAGNHPLEFATPKYESAFGRLFDAFAYNRCRTVVDAHADRMKVAGFGSDDDDKRREALEAGAETDPAATTLAQLAEDLWNANQMDVREGEIEVEAFGLGDGYLLVEVDPEGGAVYFWPQNPEQIRVRYDDARPGRIELAAKAWLDEDERMRLNLYFTDRIEKYRTVQRAPSGMPTSPRAFEPYTPEGDTAWPMPLNLDDTVPVFHFPNNGRINGYGASELGPVLPLQDALNKTLTDMMLAEEFAAFPQRVLINVDMEAEGAVDQVQRFQAAVDRLLVLMGTNDGKAPSIAEFTAANLKQYLEIAESWDVRISRASGVPVHHLMQTNAQDSGVKVRLAEAPFIAKLEDRQAAFGAVYAAAIAYGLRLQGVDVRPGDVRVNWKPAAPLGKDEAWDVSLKQKDAELPFEQRLKELGYEPEQIATIRAMKERDDARAFALVGDMAPADDEDDTEGVA